MVTSEGAFVKGKNRLRSISAVFLAAFLSAFLHASLFANAVMPCNIIPFLKYIFLIRLLETTIVMDHISDTVIISLVRNNSDMVFKDHDITALPLADIINILCERHRRMGEIYFQISHSPKINVNVRFLNIIILRMRINVLIHQFHKIIAGTPQCICHKIRTDSILVVRISV